MANHQDAYRAFPGEDRISELPDALRLQILCFLPCRDAIRTGVLSRNWKDIWKQRYDHPTTFKLGRSYRDVTDQIELASEIQHYLHAQGDKKIEVFHLYFRPEFWNRENVTMWIKNANENGVEELHLDFSQGILGSQPTGHLSSWSKKYELNENVFRFNKSLICLSLRFCTLDKSFQFKHFDHLEILGLQGVSLNDKMLVRLLANCPRLQSLELRECMSLRRIQVAGHHLQLKKLTVVHCRNIIEIHIIAPFLDTLHFFGKFPLIFSLGLVPSLSDVIIMSTLRNYWQSPNNWEIMLIELYHVKVLTLCSSSLQHIFGSRKVVRANLSYLQELQLRFGKMENSDLLNIYKFFMRYQFQQLQMLYIELPTSWHDPDEELSLEWVEKTPPQLNLECLKIVKINNFKGHVNEILLLEFLLQNATRLKLIIFGFPHHHSGIFGDATKLFERLKQKPRASSVADMVMTYMSLDDSATLRPLHSKTIQGFYTRVPTSWTRDI